jgi:predicted Rossmann fold nucleotide-binding protein DprA/Smf involved in DNA uptake
MSTLLFNLGLKEYRREGPTKRVTENKTFVEDKPIRTSNSTRRSESEERYRKTMGDMFVTASTLAKFLGYHKTSVHMHLAKLEERGLVARAGNLLEYGVQHQPSILWRWIG